MLLEARALHGSSHGSAQCLAHRFHLMSHGARAWYGLICSCLLVRTCVFILALVTSILAHLPQCVGLPLQTAQVHSGSLYLL